MLDIKDMECKYDKVIFSNLNIQNINPGMNFIIGRSGCGKTSLIKSIIGLNEHSRGSVYFKDKKIIDFRKFREEYVSMVFQDDRLIPYYTIKENLMMVSNNVQEIKSLLNKLHLINKIDCYPNALSGGQKQRINIIRALLKHSFINIFDEPTSSVNEQLKDEIMDLIKDLFKNKIVIIISHNMRLVNKYADRIINLEENTDKVVNTSTDFITKKTVFKPNLLRLNLLSYKKRSVLPVIVISIVYIIVLSTLSLFDGIDRYVDFNIQKKLDYNYFYIIDTKNNDLSSNVNRYDIKNRFKVEEIIDYRSEINDKYIAKILFNEQILTDYYEIHIYDGPDDILINSQLYDLVKTNKVKFIDQIYETKVINDGKLYTSPNIYFNYSFIHSILGDIDSKYYVFRTEQYKEVYKYMKEKYDNLFTLSDNLEKTRFDNSTVLINESLKPLLSSLHSLIILLSYSVIIMAISFIKTLIDYNIKLREQEIDIYRYFGLKNINVIPLYESMLLTSLPLVISILLFIYLSTFINKLSIYLLDEYFPMLKFTKDVLIYIILIVLLINVVIYYGNKFDKRKQKISKSKSIKEY